MASLTAAMQDYLGSIAKALTSSRVGGKLECRIMVRFGRYAASAWVVQELIFDNVWFTKWCLQYSVQRHKEGVLSWTICDVEKLNSTPIIQIV